MTGIYHYDDIVNPHPAQFKGLRVVAYSPINYRQKYFSDKAYTENGIVDYETQMQDAQRWYDKNIKLAKKESLYVQRSSKSAQSNNIHGVRNIHLTVSRDRKNGKLYPKHIRLMYQCRREGKVIASKNTRINSQADIDKYWPIYVEFKLKTEEIYPRKLWREYYLKQKPTFRKVKAHFKDRLDG